MYNKIANYYDELGWSEYSKNEVDVVNNILMNSNIIPEIFCDLGCGTGEFLYKMNKIHDETSFIGIDISEDMTQIAKKKCKACENIKIFTKDMKTLKLDKRANVITCMYDTINHLLRKDDWAETFNNVYGSLKYGGVFIIDLVPLGGLPGWEGTYVKELKGGTLIREIKYDKIGRILTTHINAFVKANYFGTYKNIKEDARETSFNLDDIIEMLKKAGFKNLEFYDLDFKRYKFFLGKLNKQSRIYIAAKK